MPIGFMYIGVIFAVCIVCFLFFKRPLYECMFVAFLVLVGLTETWGEMGKYIWDAMKEPTLYVIFAFIISAQLLNKTGIIDDCIAIILSIFGRIKGGAGYVSLIASTYVGSLSGSGPGNVATTGVFTIPAMIRSGYPPHLAANVEAHASTMGNMIPPAGMIAIAFATLDTLYPNTYTLSQYWILLWWIAFLFIIQRAVTLYFMCRYYKVESMKKEDIPHFKTAIKKGWKAIFLPIIVLVPFILTNEFDTFFEKRLGDGASALNNSLLLFIPSLIVVVSIILAGKQTIKDMKFSYILESIQASMVKIVPTAALVLFAYFVSNIFVNLNVEIEIGEYIGNWNINRMTLCFIVPLFTAVLGMLLPGSTQVKIFGGIIISVMATAGTNPMLVAAMLPCICGAMHGVTPPYCACVYTGMGIAQSEIKPTLSNCAIWCVIHYVLSVVIMLEILPIVGLLE